MALLGVRPLSVPDEGRYPEVAREMLLTGDFVTPKVNGIVFLDKPALYYWLEAGSMHVFGVNPWSIRLMPALLGVLGVVAVFVAAYRLFSRRAAWWSAAALATNPLYFLASQYADQNIEIAVWVTCALCCFLVGRREPEKSSARRWWLLGAWLAMALGILTKGLIGIVFPAMILGTWVLIRWRWRELRHWYFVSGTVLLLVVCLPWFVAVQRANPQFLHYFFVYQQFDRFTGGGFNNALPFWFYVPVVLLASLPWSVWLPLCLREQWRLAGFRGARADDNRQLLLLWPLLILVFFSIPASKIVGYIVPVLPPLSLLLGDYLARRFPAASLFKPAGEQSASRGRIALRVGVFGGAIYIVAVIVGAAFFDHSGARPLAKTLQAQMQPADELIGYRNYPQDIPIYLKVPAPLTVVDDWNNVDILKDDDWRREFYLGLQHQPEARAWLIDDDAFARRLRERKPGQRIFVLARGRDAERLVARFALHKVESYRKQVLLVTND